MKQEQNNPKVPFQNQTIPAACANAATRQLSSRSPKYWNFSFMITRFKGRLRRYQKCKANLLKPFTEGSFDLMHSA